MSLITHRKPAVSQFIHPFSIAALALAGASAFIAHDGVSAWRAKWLPHAEKQTVELTGTAKIPHVQPDTVAWSVSIDVTGKTKLEVERSVLEKSNRILADLHDAGVTQAELKTTGPTVEEVTAETTALDGSYGTPVVTGYSGTQLFQIRSSRVAASLDAYGKVATRTATWLTYESPECSLAVDGPIRRQAELAAWSDLRSSIDEAQTKTGLRLGRTIVTHSDRGSVGADSGTWTCDGGLVAKAGVFATYEVK